jgi:glycosyltransferase involved in cell wall biosynthesis
MTENSLAGELPAVLNDTVAILLCTHNGERFIAEQLDSISRQTHTGWQVWVSDDHSTDLTREILSRYRAQWGPARLAINSGPGRGFCPNFMSLVCDAAIDARWFAFCDQDDHWHPDKLQRALAWLKTIPDNVPALYCGRTRLINAAGKIEGMSPLFIKPPSLHNALVQSIAGANTMVFNRAARQLLIEAGPVDVQTHDWWLYIAVTACRGIVHYDPIPAIDYRQHGANLVGSSLGLRARAKRIKSLLAGNFVRTNERNLLALMRLERHLSPESHRLAAQFANARAGSLIPRVTGIRRAGLYRHTALGNAGLVVAALLRKL